MSRLRLTLACGDYDRTRALEDGTVSPDGIDLTYLRLPVEETFFRMLRHQEFDAAELSLSSYVLTLHQDPPPFVAIPVFPSRMFRHSAVYVRVAAGIRDPEHLVGRVVGLPEYQLTAHVWIRGILQDRHGVAVDSVTYRTGGLETPGRIEKAPLDLPPHIVVEPIPPDRTLSELLLAGELDALYTPRIPAPFARRDPRVQRLFPAVVAAERAYYEDTGIFPIMHVVVLRRSLYERHPWVAQSLTKAFERARAQAWPRLHDASALHVMLPWLNLQFEEARDLLGDHYWSYGLDPRNHHVLATFLRYHHEQGLSPRRLTPEELFAPESLEAYVI